MLKTAVARRYAKALFELIEPAQVDETCDGLTSLAASIADNHHLKHVLASPAFDFEEKRAVLTTLSDHVRCPPVVNDFLAQLIKTNRLGFLSDIAAEFKRLVEEHAGTRPVNVTSAQPLSAAEQDQLRERLQALLGREVALTVQIEPKLLAGLRIRIGSTVFDSSVRGRLDEVRTLVTKE